MAGLSFSAASALSCRALWCLALALFLCRTACGTDEVCEGIVSLTELTGRLVMVGGPGLGGRRVCKWRIDPRVELNYMSFKIDFAVFAGGDYLVLTDGDHTTLAVFAGDAPSGDEFLLLGSRVAEWTLLSTSSETRISINYACEEAFSEAPAFHEISVPQIAVLICVVGLVVLTLCFLAVMGVFYVRGQREYESMMRQSHVVRHSEHARVQRHDMSEELWVMRQLEALPEETYQHSSRDLGECCLCLENFAPDDLLRVLPCQHYFHKTCVDTWFSTGRFRARRCPLCNANPISSRRPVHNDAQVTSPAVGQVQAHNTTSSLSPNTLGRTVDVDGTSEQRDSPRGPRSLEGASVSEIAEASSTYEFVEV